MARTKPSPGGKRSLRAQQERTTPVNPRERGTGRPKKPVQVEKAPRRMPKA